MSNKKIAIRNKGGFTEWGDPILRASAKRVPLARLKTPAWRALVRRMFKMIQGVGVGLAANQIGLSDRFAIIEIKPTKSRPGLPSLGRLVIVNPRVTRYSKSVQQGWEGCLSGVDDRFWVERAEWIDVEYVDGLTGKKVECRVSGFPAVVFQHEIDHLNGKVCGEQVMVRNGRVVPGAIITLDWYKKTKGAPPKGLQ